MATWLVVGRRDLGCNPHFSLMPSNPCATNKSFAARSTHCIQKTWSTRRKHDRTNKQRRVESAPDGWDWSDEDEESRVIRKLQMKETTAWEQEHEAVIPRLVLPPPILRQSMGLGLVPAMLELQMGIDSI